MFKIISLKTLGFKRLELEEPLVFPEDRILIYGRNESGKSTIMEAIHYALYGYPLYPNRKASSEDVIRYGRDEALVELVFVVEENKYTVRRILKRKGTNTHELRILRPEGGLERIVGARRVNEAIIENLHGLDSNALLNSCLVEQKELGKLESGNRNERVKAMTNLLNIEAFVDAHEDIKDDQRELERINSSTRERLIEAETAKDAYEDAEGRKKEAEDRIASIESDLGKTEARLDELAKLLVALESAKDLANKMEKKHIEISGIEESIQKIQANLNDARAASQRVEELEALLPAAKSEFERAQAKTEVLDKLLKLESQLRETREKMAGVKKQIKNTKELVEEAERAKREVEELEPQINEYELAKTANDLLSPLEDLDRRAFNLRDDLKRAVEAKEEAASRLASLKGSKERLKELEGKISSLTYYKSKATRYRSISLAGAIAGLTIIAASIMLPLLAILGIPILIAGMFLYLRSNPARFDPEITRLQTENNALLGDQQRIGDYTDSFGKAQQAEKTAIDELARVEGDFNEKISLLPDKPSDYATVLKRDGLPPLRQKITDDLQTLTRLNTEREGAQKISNELDQRTYALKTLEEESRGYSEGLQSIQKKIDESNEAGAYSRDEEKIRGERDEASRVLTTITEEIRGKRETASKMVSIEAELSQSQEDLKKAEAELAGFEEERKRILADSGSDPNDEERLKREDERLSGKKSGLIKEKEMLGQQITESEETMAANQTLHDEYPTLQARNTSEKFEIDAMSRATKLLDWTRDSIMSGVKSSIENHMAQFLPALTENRYNMARIDEEEYQIETYDREARTWRRKGVFSGGTQDQFSLALRLAFALSTIPETRGARPGFIFLDEPLSSFDSQRREGFMNLLKNELSRHFPHIIVISHLEQLQEEFPTLIQLDSGRVV